MKKTNIYAEFRIMGDAFDPALVTRALAVQPTEVWQKGDCVYSNRGEMHSFAPSIYKLGL